MADPKPISVTYTDPGDYAGPDPQPFNIVGAPASGPVAWADVTGKPTTFAPTIGTTATTAKAGNYAPSSAEVAAGLRTKTQINALTAISTADAIDAATTQALANEAKAKVNAIIAALKA